MKNELDKSRLNVSRPKKFNSYWRNLLQGCARFGDFCANSWRLDCFSHNITMVAFTPARWKIAKIHRNEHIPEILLMSLHSVAEHMSSVNLYLTGILWTVWGSSSRTTESLKLSSLIIGVEVITKFMRAASVGDLVSLKHHRRVSSSAWCSCKWLLWDWHYVWKLRVSIVLYQGGELINMIKVYSSFKTIFCFFSVSSFKIVPMKYFYYTLLVLQNFDTM